jgi:hypothetical protein
MFPNVWHTFEALSGTKYGIRILQPGEPRGCSVCAPGSELVAVMARPVAVVAETGAIICSKCLEGSPFFAHFYEPISRDFDLRESQIRTEQARREEEAARERARREEEERQAAEAARRSGIHSRVKALRFYLTNHPELQKRLAEVNRLEAVLGLVQGEEERAKAAGDLEAAEKRHAALREKLKTELLATSGAADPEAELAELEAEDRQREEEAAAEKKRQRQIDEKLRASLARAAEREEAERERMREVKSKPDWQKGEEARRLQKWNEEQARIRQHRLKNGLPVD